MNSYLLRLRSRFKLMTGRSMFSGLWFCSVIAFRTRVPWGCRCKGWVRDWLAVRPISLLQASPVPGRDNHKNLRPFGDVLTRIPGMPQEYPMPLLLMFNLNGPNPIDRLKRQPMTTTLASYQMMRNYWIVYSRLDDVCTQSPSSLLCFKTNCVKYFVIPNGGETFRLVNILKKRE